MHRRLEILEQRARQEALGKKLNAALANYQATGSLMIKRVPVQKPIGPDVSQGAKQWLYSQQH